MYWMVTIKLTDPPKLRQEGTTSWWQCQRTIYESPKKLTASSLDFDAGKFYEDVIKYQQPVASFQKSFSEHIFDANTEFCKVDVSVSPTDSDLAETWARISERSPPQPQITSDQSSHLGPIDSSLTENESSCLKPQKITGDYQLQTHCQSATLGPVQNVVQRRISSTKQNPYSQKSSLGAYHSLTCSREKQTFSDIESEELEVVKEKKGSGCSDFLFIESEHSQPGTSRRSKLKPDICEIQVDSEGWQIPPEHVFSPKAINSDSEDEQIPPGDIFVLPVITRSVTMTSSKLCSSSKAKTVRPTHIPSRSPKPKKFNVKKYIEQKTVVSPVDKPTRIPIISPEITNQSKGFRSRSAMKPVTHRSPVREQENKRISTITSSILKEPCNLEDVEYSPPLMSHYCELQTGSSSLSKHSKEKRPDSSKLGSDEKQLTYSTPRHSETSSKKIISESDTGRSKIIEVPLQDFRISKEEQELLQEQETLQPSTLGEENDGRSKIIEVPLQDFRISEEEQELLQEQETLQPSTLGEENDEQNLEKEADISKSKFNKALSDIPFCDDEDENDDDD